MENIRTVRGESG